MLQSPLRSSPGHVDADAGPAKTQRIVDVQQGAGIELVADGFEQHPLVVQLLLHGNRRRLIGRQVHAAVRAHRLHGAGGAHEKIPLRMRVPLGVAPGGFLRRRNLLLLGQLLLDVVQVLQGLGFHSSPFSAIDSASPGATIT